MSESSNCMTHSSEYPRLPQVAVGAVVFRNGRVLLVRRGRPPARNQWAIPGGRVNLGENLQSAAERETFEETGIVIKARNPVYVFEHIEKDSAGRTRFHYVIVDLLAEYVAGEPLPSDDALEARWVGAEDIAPKDVSATTRRLLETQFDFRL